MKQIRKISQVAQDAKPVIDAINAATNVTASTSDTPTTAGTSVEVKKPTVSQWLLIIQAVLDFLKTIINPTKWSGHGIASALIGILSTYAVVTNNTTSTQVATVTQQIATTKAVVDSTLRDAKILSGAFEVRGDTIVFTGTKGK
jgi:hypothetical protein